MCLHLPFEFPFITSLMPFGSPDRLPLVLRPCSPALAALPIPPLATSSSSPRRPSQSRFTPRPASSAPPRLASSPAVALPGWIRRLLTSGCPGSSTTATGRLEVCPCYNFNACQTSQGSGHQ